MHKKPDLTKELNCFQPNTTDTTAFSLVRKRVLDRANILVAGAAIGLSAFGCGIHGDPAPTPICSDLHSNDDANDWLGHTAEWKSEKKEQVVLTIYYPYEKLVPKGDPEVTGATVVSAKSPEENQLVITLEPNEGVTTPTVLVGSTCDGDSYRSLVRVYLEDDRMTEPLAIFTEILDPDLVDGGVEDTDK